MDHMPPPSTWLTRQSVGFKRGQSSRLRGERRRLLQTALTVLPRPQRRIERSLSHASATDCCFVFFFSFPPGVKRRQRSAPCTHLFSVSWSPLYGNDTPGCPGYSWGSQKALIGNHSALLTDGFHSTRPDNHSQLGPFIRMQLFTISPYPEQIHTRKHTGAL